jgi:dipeptidyl aminopeptidase/acylaminoacyl peptidase
MKRTLLSVLTWILVTIALLVAAHPSAAQQPAFSIEQVMSAPVPSNLVAAPGTGAVAWVENAEGVRNVWVATAPEYRGKQLTAYTADDAQTLNALQFTPDGSEILYVRGDGPNRAGELPNPLSETESPERALFRIGVGGGEPVKVRDGGSVTLSPDGTTALFTKQGAVWIMPLAEPEEAEELFQARGGLGSFQYSPDGSLLAFVSRRAAHSFIGVYSFSDDSIRWMSPGVWTDGVPVWSPDGTQVAFVRTLSAPSQMFSAKRETAPFSIRVASVATGESRQVFRADSGPGSVARSWGGSGSLHWGAGDHLVFPWEKNGWLQIWSVPAAGGDPVLLTPGEGEVQFADITPDRREMVYDSNVDDIDRKHLFRVRVDGSTPPRQITSGTGIEWGARVTTDGAVAFMASDGTTPAHAVLLEGGDRRDLHDGWMPGDFPSDRLVQPQQVIFTASDGMMIHGQLFLPEDIAEGERRPALLFFHGGSRRQMLLGFHHRGYYHNAYAMNQYLASQGYIVLAVNYRSGVGYGLNFREALDYGATGASEFRDVTGAGAYLRNRPDVDADRIGLWGGSYGGYLTALGLARASDMFAAGVDMHGVHDWNTTINGFRPQYNRGEFPEFARKAFESSPMAFVDSWRSPVLLIHGDDDRNVPFQESVNLAYALSTRGVYFEQLVFPDEVHGFLLHRSWLAAYGATADFFDRMLMDGAAGDHTKVN